MGTSRENLENREGQTDSTPLVEKYHCTWTTKGVRCYPKSQFRGLYRGPLYMIIKEPRFLQGDNYTGLTIAPLLEFSLGISLAAPNLAPYTRW